ncbi:unnamed protein product [Prorocentrum cordatum]|uniref:Uncharacterized protein n=1 Tax=Prorocentrum cordatum TaxID=2364126 RepID=A0ABN9SXL4_9DINO|nr:unnamed protein product [Polarella glacialis]
MPRALWPSPPAYLYARMHSLLPLPVLFLSVLLAAAASLIRLSLQCPSIFFCVQDDDIRQTQRQLVILDEQSKDALNLVFSLQRTVLGIRRRLGEGVPGDADADADTSASEAAAPPEAEATSQAEPPKASGTREAAERPAAIYYPSASERGLELRPKSPPGSQAAGAAGAPADTGPGARGEGGDAGAAEGGGGPAAREAPEGEDSDSYANETFEESIEELDLPGQ